MLFTKRALALLLIGLLGLPFAQVAAAGQSGPSAATANSTSTGTWWVGAYSYAQTAMPNAGVSSSLQVISQQVSGCLAFWVSDDSASNIWGQVGYYMCNGSTPVAFYQVWDLNTNAVLATGTAPVSTGSHAFSMYDSGGTLWSYALDGVAFGTYDMGSNSSSSSYPVYAMSEETQVSAPFAFPAVTFGTALLADSTGSWDYVGSAAAYGSGWGVQGQSQNASLSPDEVVVGGSVAPLSQGSNLWTGTPSSPPPQNTPPPTVAITSPAAGQTISGTTAVQVSANSSVGIASVSLYVDGSLYSSSTSSPYSFALKTTSLSNGAHSLYAVAYDSAGNAGSSSTISVNVSNTVAAPTVAILSPTDGATVSGTITISASASSSAGIAQVSFYLDSSELCTVTASPYTCNLNTRHLSGTHTITVIAFDNLGNSAQASITITVSGSSHHGRK